MKAGFWAAPDGDDAPLVVVPVAAAAPDHGLAGTGGLAALATADAAALIARCPNVAALLPFLAAALDQVAVGGEGTLVDLAPLNADERALLGDVFGTGEVAATVALPDGVTAQISESVFAGLWRVRFTDAAGAPIADYAETGAIPRAVTRAAAMTAAEVAIGTPPEGAMNVMPVLAEIRDRVRRRPADTETHVISLSLLPMTPQDLAFLQETLGGGPVRIVSRGYGSCRVLATGVRDVWSVQFFNAADTIVLDTLEIGGVPQVACAASDDCAESAARLRDVAAAYFE